MLSMRSRAEIWQDYYKKNRKRLLENGRQYRLKNIKKHLKYDKDRYWSNPEFHRNRWKKYSRTHRATINKTRRERYATDMHYKLKCIIRARLISTIKQDQKKGSILNLLGCTIPELKVHIEKQFRPGMTWKNWSYKGWHIDHKKPLASFNLKNQKQLSIACHFTNLQPLWSIENHIKGNRT